MKMKVEMKRVAITEIILWGGGCVREKGTTESTTPARDERMENGERQKIGE